jgi:hypothetical protein
MYAWAAFSVQPAQQLQRLLMLRGNYSRRACCSSGCRNVYCHKQSERTVMLTRHYFLICWLLFDSAEQQTPFLFGGQKMMN